MLPSDWDDIKLIYKNAIDEGISTFQTECPSFEEWDSSHIKDCRFVLTVGGEIAGWCALSQTSSREAYRGVVEVSIYFKNIYRGQGFGTKLLKHLCAESEAHGYWCLYSSIFSINDASIRLHEKCGFRRIGYRENIARDRFGVWRDTVLFERRNTYYG